MRLARRDSPGHYACMLREFFWALLDAAVYLILWIAPVAFILAGTVVAVTVARGNERAQRWIVLLILAVGILSVIVIADRL